MSALMSREPMRHGALESASLVAPDSQTERTPPVGGTRNVHRLSVGARLALLLMRGTDVGLEGSEMEQVFLSLSTHLRKEGCILGAPHAGFVNDHERTVIAWLAFFQRKQISRGVPAVHGLENELAQRLRAAALTLDRAGMRLQYRHILGLPQSDPAPAASIRFDSRRAFRRRAAGR